MKHRMLVFAVAACAAVNGAGARAQERLNRGTSNERGDFTMDELRAKARGFLGLE